MQNVPQRQPYFNINLLEGDTKHSEKRAQKSIYLQISRYTLLKHSTMSYTQNLRLQLSAPL